MNTLAVETTPRTVARLIMTGEIPMRQEWKPKDEDQVFNALLMLEMTTVLDMIDAGIGKFESETPIPFYGNIEELKKVPFILKQRGGTDISFQQLGVNLQGADVRTMESARRFGNTYGHTANDIGIAIITEDGQLTYSCLTNAYINEPEEIKRHKVIALLCLRYPVVRRILRDAAKKKVCGTRYLLEESGNSVETLKKRCRAVNRILTEAAIFESEELSQRIANIHWITFDKGDEMNAVLQKIRDREQEIQ